MIAGIEPATFPLSGERSDQLSYTTKEVIRSTIRSIRKLDTINLHADRAQQTK